MRLLGLSVLLLSAGCQPATHENVLAKPSELRVLQVKAATANVIPAHDAAGLKAALLSAKPADTIQLDAGTSYAGAFAFKQNVTVTTAGYPGTARVTVADAVNMAKIISPGTNSTPVTVPPGASVTFVGVEVTQSSDPKGLATLCNVQGDATFDRCYIHGLDGLGCRRGIAANGSLKVTNSIINNIKWVGQDAQAIGGWAGPGPFVIDNNELEASGENVMFGGADPSIVNLVPGQQGGISITHNLFTKRLSWRASDPSYTGIHWTVKNLLELKNAVAATIDGNTFEYCWIEAQTGIGIQFTPRNANGKSPWSVVTGVTFSNNIVRHCANGISILNSDTEVTHQAAGGSGIASNIHIGPGNTWSDLSGVRWGNGVANSFWFQMVAVEPLKSAKGIVFDGNTVADVEGSVVSFTGKTPTLGFSMANCTMPYGKYGFHTGSGEGPNQTACPGFTWSNIRIIGTPISHQKSYPAGTVFQ